MSLIFFFLLFYFFVSCQRFKVYVLSHEELNLGNSLLVINNDNIILEIDKITKQNSEILNYSIYLNKENDIEEIVYKDSNTNLVLIDNTCNPIYFPKNFLKNKKYLTLKITYNENNELKTKEYNLKLTGVREATKYQTKQEYLIKKQNTKTLLKNNGYSMYYKNYYEKEEENLKLIYDLNTNTFNYTETVNDLTYNLVYQVDQDLITIKTYYNSNYGVLVMEANLNPNTKDLTCKLGECPDLNNIYNKMCEKYNLISDSSLTRL